MRRLRWVVCGLAALSLEACASAPAGEGGETAGEANPATQEVAAAAESVAAESAAAPAPDQAPGIGLREPAGTLASDEAAGTQPSSPAAGGAVPRSRTYPGFLTANFATEPLALLPVVRVIIPAEISSGQEGQALVEDLKRLVLDRLPAEIRIVRPRAPVYPFRSWAQGRDVGPQSGYLSSILGWSGTPGEDGAIPEVVGNSVEALGDNRGIRYFLFPRSLEIFHSGRLRYAAVLQAYLLDARGERAVWSGSGWAEGTLPEDEPGQFLRGVVRDAAVAAVADLAARLPGSERALPRGDFRGNIP
ncbi:MAG TPA: hypothetical protein VIC59_06450 [Gemmatimonadota bacterium]